MRGMWGVVEGGLEREEGWVREREEDDSGEEGRCQCKCI